MRRLVRLAMSACVLASAAQSFALELETSCFGNYWTTPSWCPKATDRRLTPGSDAFVKEDNYQLTTNGAAAFYSVLDAYDVRRFVFSNGSDTNIAKHVVSSSALVNYGEMLARKSALRNVSCFGDGDSLAGGESIDKWTLANGYAAFGGYDWSANPFPDPSKKAIVWFPTSRMFGSDDIFTGDAENGGIAKTVLEAISYIPLGWNDWYGHDWDADRVYDEDTGNFKKFLTNAYERVWLDSMTNNTRVIDWKPVEMAAKVMGAYDKLYEVSAQTPYSSITNVNSIAGSVTYKSSGSSVSRVRFVGVSQPSGEIVVVDTQEGQALPIGAVTETNDLSVVSLPADGACPSIDVSAVRATGGMSASVKIGEFSIVDDLPWKQALGAYLHERGEETCQVVSTLGRSSGFHLAVVGGSFTWSDDYVFDSIWVSPGMLTMAVSGSARASYGASDSIVSAVTNESALCTISTNIASFVTNVNYYAFMASSNTADGVAYKCAKYVNRTIRGANGYGAALRNATSSLDARVDECLEANIYDATDYCDFSEADARRIWGACSNLALSVRYGGGDSTSVATNHAVVALAYSEMLGYYVDVVSGSVPKSGDIIVALDESAAIADMRDAYHGNSKMAWVSEANVCGVPIKQTSGGERMKNGTLKLTSNTMPENMCKDAFAGMNMRKVDASDPVVTALRGSFYGAFANCTNLYVADFGECRTAGDDSFNRSFRGCVRLVEDDFEKLERAGDSCFLEAHVGTSVTNAHFLLLASCGHKAFKDSYADVTNVCDVRFPVLLSCGSNAFDHAFAILNTNRCSNIGIADFGSLESAGVGAFNKAFVGSANLSYASFDSLKSGMVDLSCDDDYAGLYWPSEAPLVLSCSNIAASAVIDISKRKNVTQIRFDTVSAVVNFNSAWIPQNADWTAYVPGELYFDWTDSASGWYPYESHVVAVSPAFKWHGLGYMPTTQGLCQLRCRYQSDGTPFTVEAENDDGEVVSTGYYDYGGEIVVYGVATGQRVRVVAIIGGKRIPSEFVTIPAD